MKIVKPYAKIIPELTKEMGIAMLKKIESVARISHRSEDMITEDSWKRFVPAVVLQHGDWSVTEHVIIGVEFCVDRGITHELVRHRIGSYTQESTRFVNYDKKMPPSFIEPFFDNVNNNAIWMDTIAFCEESYKKLIRNGAPPQLARSIFPNSLASIIYVTYNLRSWRWFFIMRTTKEAHPQMREVTIPLLLQFKENIPYLFDDIEPEQSQAFNLRSLAK